MSFSLPPVVKQAERLLVEIENAVRRFSRYNKYTSGTDLRQQTMRVCKLTHRAWRDRVTREASIIELVAAVDDLKIHLQLCSRLKAFASFQQFEMISRLAAELGQQVGGWHKIKHCSGQNAVARNATPQRAKILSARAASQHEASV